MEQKHESLNTLNNKIQSETQNQSTEYFQEEVNPTKKELSPSPSSSPKNKKKSEHLNDNNQFNKSKKNLNINFIKAIFTFANSHLAIPYLKPLLQKEEIKFSDFTSFIHQYKPSVNGIYALLSMLVEDKSNNQKIVACKRIFKALSEIFIKFFSVNWIFHGKVENKQLYLDYRFKLLRRIQNPQEYLSK